MFDFEPESTSPNHESLLIIVPSPPFVYGLDFDESRINLTINYLKQPPKSSPNFGKVLRKFESECKSRLHEAMIVCCSSTNPDASDSAWEAYRSWMNFSQISKLKDIGYTLAERKFRSGSIPLMELWKLRNSQLCLPAQENNEATPEVMEEEAALAAPKIKIAQHIESAPEADAASEPQDCDMEEATTQIVV